MKRRIPLQLPKVKGCQSVTKARQKMFKLVIPPPRHHLPLAHIPPLPLLHSLLVREGGPCSTQHLQKAAKRQQWWGRGREPSPGQWDIPALCCSRVRRAQCPGISGPPNSTCQTAQLLRLPAAWQGTRAPGPCPAGQRVAGPSGSLVHGTQPACRRLSRGCASSRGRRERREQGERERGRERVGERE